MIDPTIYHIKSFIGLQENRGTEKINQIGLRGNGSTNVKTKQRDLLLKIKPHTRDVIDEDET